MGKEEEDREDEERDVILCDFKVAVSSSAFRMHDTLGNALSVEMCVLLEQVKVFKHGIPTLSDCQTGKAKSSTA
jgi:hypothetical protein